MLNRLPALLFILLIFSSCKEFIEPSIEKKTVALKAPGDAFETTTYTINFWWETVDDALTYRLQIVTPSFASTTALVTDTLVNTDKFSLTLEPGQYQWRVRAENGSSQTAYAAYRSITVIPGSLGEQTMVLTAPANHWLGNTANVRMQWKNLFGATKYRLQVDKGTFTVPLVDNELPALEYHFDFPADGTYYWRVQALNEDGSQQSKWSNAFSLTYDSTPPGKPVLRLPADESAQVTPVTLDWNTVNSAVQYKVYIYENDGSTLLTGYPKLSNTASATINTTVKGRLYWRISALDEAGNESVTSDMRSFVLQ